jgi:peroxiredoxin
MKYLLLILLFVTCTCSAQMVQNFSLTNVSSGQYVALADFYSKPGVVIIFTSTDCPYDNFYLSRIQELVATYQSRLPILLINSNLDESMDQMKKYASEKNITVPYLWDLEQKAMSALGARKNPECFLLQPSGDKFKVVFKGAFDDNPQTPSAVNKFYLRDAIENLLSKMKIETTEVRPVGCSIH